MTPPDHPQPLVSILMVGYNSAAYLPAALGAIPDACARHPFEVLFIDNGTDGSAQMVEDRFPAVRVLPSRGNIGFGAACNVLARAARGRWLLLLNPDTSVWPGAIDLLLDAARAHPQFPILGGLATDAAGRPLPVSPLWFPTPARLLGAILAIRPGGGAGLPGAAVAPVDAVSGGFMLIKRAVWEALEGFDERFFLYAEELDLCRRAAARGWRTALVSAARVVHHVGSGAPDSRSRMLARMRGAATYYRRHHGLLMCWLCLALHWAGEAARLAFLVLRAPGDARARTRAAGLVAVVLAPWRWVGGYRQSPRR